MAEQTPTRRTVIVAGLACLSSGCSSFQQSNSQGDGCSYEATTKSFSPVEDLPPDYSPSQRELAHRVIRQESVTAFYGPPPLKNDSFVGKDGTFYRIVLTDTHTAQLPALVMTVTWNSGRQPPEDATPHSFTDLPQADRLALRSIVYGGIYRSQTHPEASLVHSESPVPYPNGMQESVLATCDSCWVRWKDQAYQVISHREETIEKAVYTYSASEFATNAQTFREQIIDEHLVRLDDITPKEQAILDEAIGGKYKKQTQSRFSPFHRLRDRLPNHTVPESGGKWFIEYKGKRYGLDLSFVCQGVESI